MAKTGRYSALYETGSDTVQGLLSDACFVPIADKPDPARAVIYDSVLLRYLHKTQLQYCMASQLRSTSWVLESPNVGS